jgi:hypothetical protein
MTALRLNLRTATGGPQGRFDPVRCILAIARLWRWARAVEREYRRSGGAFAATPSSMI